MCESDMLTQRAPANHPRGGVGAETSHPTVARGSPTSQKAVFNLRKMHIPLIQIVFWT